MGLGAHRSKYRVTLIESVESRVDDSANTQSDNRLTQIRGAMKCPFIKGRSNKRIDR